MELPAEDSLRWIVRSYAQLRAAHGTAIGTPELVQPTGDFFPDEFRGDAPSVARLLARMIEYSPLAEGLGIELGFAQGESGSEGGCGSLACGPKGGAVHGLGVVERDDGYRVVLAATDVANPEVLAASLARTVGALVRLEGGDSGAADTASLSAERSEVTAVACGFGVLLANGSAVWAKSCGGLRMAQATSLSVEEIGVALALFVAIGGAKVSEARVHLGTTQREALDHALAWTESNPLLVETLRDGPALLEHGTFAMEPVRGLIGRWLHKRKLDPPAAVALRRPAPASPTKEVSRHLREAQALIDEVYGEG